MPNSTETARMTLTGFLLARIAEDEAAARAATQGFLATDGPEAVWSMDSRETPRTGEHVLHASFEDNGPENVAHVIRHDPARVLAECEAKRRIVELHDDALKRELARQDASAWGADLMHGDALRLLALPYADHPDYREEWKL